MLLEERIGERQLRLRGRGHGPGRREEMIVAPRRVIEPLELLEDQVAVESERADPEEIRIGVLDARGDRSEIARAELVLEIEQDLEPALGRDVARAGGLELGRRELARDDRHRLRRVGGGGHGVEDDGRHRLVRLGPEGRRRELHLVLGQVRHAEAVVNEQLLIALRHAHRGDDRAGRVGPHQQIDLVDGDQLLVERAGDLGLGLVVQQHPSHGAAEQAVVPVQLLDVDLGGDLVQERGCGDGPRERERAADPDRWTGRRRDRGHREGHGEHGAQQGREARSGSRAHLRLLGGVKAAPEPTRR